MNPCDVNRREFLKTGFGGLVGAIVASRWDARLLAGDAILRRKAKACILLWMAGGPSQIDTFDPKPGTDNGGPFKPIETAVSGIRVSEHLPKVAQQAKHLAIVRSMTTKEGNHDRATYLMHTGYSPQATVRHASLGAIVAAEVGDPNFDLPSFISIGGPSGDGGYLGPRYNPFVIQNPTKPPDNLHPPGGLDAGDLDRRMKLLEGQEKEFTTSRGSPQSEAHKEIYLKAQRMMKSPLAKAFDVSQEKQALRDEYGTNTFGTGCLMARRLVEVGARFVEVSLGGWDTHRDNFEAVKARCGILDPGMAALLKDLDSRGMLEETMVIWMGDFGRTPKINANAGRDHFPRAWSVVLAGGGVKGGQVIGATDATGMEVKERPVRTGDLFATIASAFGLEYTKERITPEGRPITMVEKDAKIVKELF
jgi:hypothetical protein